MTNNNNQRSAFGRIFQPLLILTSMAVLFVCLFFVPVSAEENDSFLVKLPDKKYTYDGFFIEPKVKVLETKSGHLLKEGEDYQVFYSDNINAGKALITVNGLGPYKDVTVQKTFKIRKAVLTEAELSFEECVYDGTLKTPEVVVSAQQGDRNVTLLQGRDYSVTYENNVAAGEGSVTVKGKGNYKESITKTFFIKPSDCFAFSVSDGNWIYTGSENCPGVSVHSGNMELAEGVDYELSYRDNIGVGEGTVVVTGIGNYTGEKEAGFTINEIDYLAWARQIADNDAYVYGHEPPNNYSCSTLVAYALASCGYTTLPTISPKKGWMAGLNSGKGVEGRIFAGGFSYCSNASLGIGESYAAALPYLKPGDILYRNDAQKGRHMGFYLGDGLTLEARGGTGPDAIGIFGDFGYMQGFFRLPEEYLG